MAISVDFAHATIENTLMETISIRHRLENTKAKKNIAGNLSYKIPSYYQKNSDQLSVRLFGNDWRSLEH